jgi:hypothetical protein
VRLLSYEPEDYIACMMKKSPDTTTAQFFCKSGASPGYRSDHDLHDKAKKV